MTVVLGAGGMLGRVVFWTLRQGLDQPVTGTVRPGSAALAAGGAGSLRPLSVKSWQADLEALGPIELVVNCIAALKGRSREELKSVNTLFPIALEQWCQARSVRLVHISTDAVFPPLAGPVNETSPTDPDWLIEPYGQTKLLGELTGPLSLTIRSSIIGLDPVNKKGILEQTRQESAQPLVGFTNQTWSGATVLELANFIADLAKPERWRAVKAQTALIHFAPLGPITKYELISQWLKLAAGPITVTPGLGRPISRYLTTGYPALIRHLTVVNDIPVSLRQLLDHSTNQKGISDG